MSTNLLGPSPLGNGKNRNSREIPLVHPRPLGLGVSGSVEASLLLLALPNLANLLLLASLLLLSVAIVVVGLTSGSRGLRGGGRSLVGGGRSDLQVVVAQVFGSSHLRSSRSRFGLDLLVTSTIVGVFTSATRTSNLGSTAGHVSIDDTLNVSTRVNGNTGNLPLGQVGGVNVIVPLIVAVAKHAGETTSQGGEVVTRTVEVDFETGGVVLGRSSGAFDGASVVVQSPNSVSDKVSTRRQVVRQVKSGTPALFTGHDFGRPVVPVGVVIVLSNSKPIESGGINLATRVSRTLGHVLGNGLCNGAFDVSA